MRTVTFYNLGRTNYESTWRLQHALFDGRAGGRIGDTVLITEHDHVYTIGKGGDSDHLLASPEELLGRGARLFAVDRGGDITYHGPGQIVCYPILKLDEYYSDVHRYLRDLEEVVIRTLAGYGIAASRDEGMTGVWRGNEKIAAVGVRVSRWTTMHGFALNVNTDCSYFDRIIPCGIFHKGVTTMERILRSPQDLAGVAGRIAASFGDVFGAQILPGDPGELQDGAGLSFLEHAVTP